MPANSKRILTFSQLEGKYYFRSLLVPTTIHENSEGHTPKIPLKTPLNKIAVHGPALFNLPECEPAGHHSQHCNRLKRTVFSALAIANPTQRRRGTALLFGVRPTVGIAVTAREGIASSSLSLNGCGWIHIIPSALELSVQCINGHILRLGIHIYYLVGSTKEFRFDRTTAQQIGSYPKQERKQRCTKQPSPEWPRWPLPRRPSRPHLRLRRHMRRIRRARTPGPRWLPPTPSRS